MYRCFTFSQTLNLLIFTLVNKWFMIKNYHQSYEKNNTLIEVLNECFNTLFFTQNKTRLEVLNNKFTSIKTDSNKMIKRRVQNDPFFQIRSDQNKILKPLLLLVNPLILISNTINYLCSLQFQ